MDETMLSAIQDSDPDYHARQTDLFLTPDVELVEENKELGIERKTLVTFRPGLL